MAFEKDKHHSPTPLLGVVGTSTKPTAKDAQVVINPSLCTFFVLGETTSNYKTLDRIILFNRARYEKD